MAETNDLNRAMLLIKSLDRDASLLLSEWTGQWYVSANIEVGGDGVLSGITEHRDTPYLAVFAFLDQLKTVDLDHYLKTGIGDERRHWRWNGAAFAEVVRRG